MKIIIILLLLVIVSGCVNSEPICGVSINCSPIDYGTVEKGLRFNDFNCTTTEDMEINNYFILNNTIVDDKGDVVCK